MASLVQRTRRNFSLSGSRSALPHMVASISTAPCCCRARVQSQVRRGADKKCFLVHHSPWPAGLSDCAVLCRVAPGTASRAPPRKSVRVTMSLRKKLDGQASSHR